MFSERRHVLALGWSLRGDEQGVDRQAARGVNELLPVPEVPQVSEM